MEKTWVRLCYGNTLYLQRHNLWPLHLREESVSQILIKRLWWVPWRRSTGDPDGYKEGSDLGGENNKERLPWGCDGRWGEGVAKILKQMWTGQINYKLWEGKKKTHRMFLHWFSLKYLIFIYLFDCARSSLRHVGVATCKLLWTLSFSLWDLVPWPVIKSGPPALGVQSPSHWTNREVPLICTLKHRIAFVKAEASFQRAYLVRLIDFASQGMWTEGIQYPGLYLCLSHWQVAWF